VAIGEVFRASAAATSQSTSEAERYAEASSRPRIEPTCCIRAGGASPIRSPAAPSVSLVGPTSARTYVASRIASSLIVRGRAVVTLQFVNSHSSTCSRVTDRCPLSYYDMNDDLRVAPDPAKVLPIGPRLGRRRTFGSS
jgi:hypothetical protein